jgi:hypothetical protein
MMEATPLTVVGVGSAITVTTGTTSYRYSNVHPSNECKDIPLKRDDIVHVRKIAPNKDILVRSLSGCEYFLSGLIEEKPT